MTIENTSTSDTFNILRALAGAVDDLDGYAVPYVIGTDKSGATCILSIEHLLGCPTRIREVLEVADLDSFGAYFARFKCAGTLVRAKRLRTVGEPLKVTAVLDYHGAPHAPDNGDHVLTLSLEAHPDARRWGFMADKMVTQMQFAEFMQDAAVSILAERAGDPSAADMLELSRHFEARSTGHFRSAVNLDNGGVQLSYSHEVTGGNPRATVLEAPREFAVTFPLWEGIDIGIALRARLRYRQKDAGLLLGYSWIRPELATVAAGESLLAALRAITRDALLVVT